MKKNYYIQHFKNRVKHPQIHITYDDKIPNDDEHCYYEKCSSLEERNVIETVENE